MTRSIIFIITLLVLLPLPVQAYDDVEEYITPEMREYLGDDILTEDNIIDYSVAIESIRADIGSYISKAAERFLSILGILIMAAVFSVYSASICSDAMKKCFSFLTTAVLAVILFGVLYEIWQEMSELLGEINIFVTALTPVTTILYSLGGNITTATVNNSAMSLILTVFENICYHGIMPMLQICFGFSIVSVLSPGLSIRSISGFVRKTYTTVLIFAISMMTTILSLQNMLSSSNDSLAMRTIKFASSSSVPIVGGCLGEATETVAAGIGAVRTTFGILAIIAIAVMVLPGIISLWLNKLAFSLGSAVAGIFGLSKEGELISDACELINFALAITAACSVMFIICIAVFAGAATAVGG